ncbi:MAG TPA: proline iminopeptidase-family hydrolase, partial [Ktedonobacterales bacterium]|nr:proline iminopeptidase-family hydrolase [Ktedonobacterales bacterium]
MADTTWPTTEGYIPFHGYRTWYCIVGDPAWDVERAPILLLHGGPGATHDYLEPLEALADSQRRVILYDQLGAGNSDHPHDPTMWTVALYVEELAAVREALGLSRVHILGQSWGGMLAMEYALTQPQAVLSLVIADSPASMQQWVAEANRLRAELPPEVQQTLLEHEAAGTTESPEYQEAMQAFYQRHVCRLDPLPDYVARSFQKMAAEPEVYYTMNGPSEFHVIGTIKDWDIVDRLGEIHIPTLLISGR